MKPISPNELKIRRVLNTLVLLIVVAYLSQAAFIHLRLNLMHAEKENLINIADSCDEANCTGKWSITPKANLLLLGHLMRTHKLEIQDSGAQVFPISRVRGITADSWSGLRVYEVTPGSTYTLTITKPKAVKMGYFIGILPRSTSHEGVLSIPDISPTISTMATMAGFGLLGILIFAAFLAPKTGSHGMKNREKLILIAVSAVAAAIVSAIGSGTIDSLLPDGELRSKILRTMLVTAISTIPLMSILNSKINILTISTHILAVALAINLNWDFFRAGIGYISTLTSLTLLFSLHQLVRKNFISAALLVFGFYDTFIMYGMGLKDMPPTYLLHIFLIASLCQQTVHLGSASIIAMASRAYFRFTRDISIAKINSILAQNATEGSSISESVKQILPLISNLSGANKVSILVNLPFGRPIMHSYTSSERKFVTHDDGRIPGAVTIRAFVYGDETWYEKYQDFSKRLKIPSAKHLERSDYICVAPIRVNQNNMGVLVLTSFQDKAIEKLIKSGEIDDERETGKLIVDNIASSFSEVILQHLKSNSIDSNNILTQLREAIPNSSSADDFLQKFCDSIHSVTGLRVMIHRWELDKGIPLKSSGFIQDEWSFFANAPFNLDPNAQKSYGPTVVAFKEQKSSYLKDWKEIQDKLHEKTIEILAKIDSKTFLAIPLSNGNIRYVITLISRRNDLPKDPGLMSIVEGTEAIFDAAITVLDQKTSVMALGKLANRLIGDDDVREQIINAAKSETLPTTIGTPRTSFLLLFDLVGSSNLEGDTEHKAKCYGFFYDEVNRSIQENLGGKIRKTIGDAIIATWDGSKSKLEEQTDLPNRLLKVASHANFIATTFGCRGIRAVLHYGDYFFGLVGTASFGQIDVIGKGIDEVCKMEGHIKSVHNSKPRLLIAVSKTAIDKLSTIQNQEWLTRGYIQHDSLELKNYLTASEDLLTENIQTETKFTIQLVENAS